MLRSIFIATVVFSLLAGCASVPDLAPKPVAIGLFSAGGKAPPALLGQPMGGVIADARRTPGDQQGLLLILIGDDLPLTTTSLPYRYAIFFGLALLLLVGVIVLIKKRKKTT